MLHRRQLRTSKLLAAAITIICSQACAFAAEDDNAGQQSKPLKGGVTKSDLQKRADEEARKPLNKPADYKFVLTPEYIFGFVKTALPLEKPERSKADNRLVSKIKAQAARNAIDKNSLKELYKLRVAEKNYHGADNCLSLLRMIILQHPNHDAERHEWEVEAESLRSSRELKRLEKAEWFMSHGKFLEAQHELQMAQLFFKDKDEYKKISAKIETDLRHLDSIVPKDPGASSRKPLI
jgi:hypothetical protein